MKNELVQYYFEMIVQADSKFQANSHKGNSWKTCDPQYLNKRLKEELVEFLEYPSTAEAGDIINFLAMILDRR